MGVHGLWKLIDPCGRPVPLESLDNQILAVDVSIWLHQALKGFRDAHGNTLNNAHLLIIFHRLCKLLFYRIRPIIVFDGQVPQLKIDTIASRNRQRSKYLNDAEKIREKLLKNAIKTHAIDKVMTSAGTASSSTSTKLPIFSAQSEKPDLFYLPDSANISFESDFSDFSDDEPDSRGEQCGNESDKTGARLRKNSHEEKLDLIKQWTIDSIYEKNEQFKKLPVETRHEILTEVKESRKQSSWKRLHELPTESTNFAQFQMERLLKRQKIQENLNEIQNQVTGKNYTLRELEIILTQEGVLIPEKISNVARIDSNDKRGYVFVKDVQKAVEQAKLSQESQTDEDSKQLQQPSTSSGNKEIVENQTESDRNETFLMENDEDADANDSDISGGDEDEDLQRAIKLSLEESVASTSTVDDSGSYLSSSNTESFSLSQDSRLSLAKNFMMEYSGLSINEISKIIDEKEPKKSDVETNETIDYSNDLDSDRSDTNSDEFIDVSDIDDGNNDVSNKNDVISVTVNRNVGQFDSSNDLFSDIFSSNDKSSVNDQASLNEIVEEPKIVESLSKKNLEKKQTIVEQEKECSVRPLSPDQEPLDSKREKIEISTVESVPEIVVQKENEFVNVDLEVLQKELEKNRKELNSERNVKERLAANITDIMIDDTKELLKLFGVPFVDSETEAEAQCAFLEENGITNGTITDDSDIWLFGGHRVYKNFFNQSKRVLKFESNDVERSFKLNRKRLVLFAMLVGSDYTVGIRGIGPVTALEVLAHFFDSDDLLNVLVDFRTWFLNDKDCRNDHLKAKIKHIRLPVTFPNTNVIRAYLEPEVKTEIGNLRWRAPDFEKLTKFAELKFGWDAAKSETVLKPLRDKLEMKSTQKRIEHYFELKRTKGVENPSKKLSKRVKRAISQMNLKKRRTDEPK